MFTTGDPDYLMGNADLSGADTWTVATKCEVLGDSTMIEDIRYGIKPAWRLLIGFYDGPEAMQRDNDFIKSRGKELADEYPDMYRGSKGAVHGSNYKLQPAKGVEIILKQSMGKVLMGQQDFKTLQDLYMLSYQGVKLWQEDVQRQLLNRGFLRGAGGHKRIFFERRSSDDTLRVALAEEPQQNTTYATKLAMSKLFFGRFNRCQMGKMIVEMQNTVHDSIVYKFRKKYIDGLNEILGEAFDNELIIEGRKVKIGYEYDTGECWPKG